MASIETVASFIRRVRRRLDEQLDPGTNFWADSELIELMNEGCREVWQTVREAHEDRFVRTFQSSDGVINVAGRDYDTALLAIKSGRGELVLPPDFHELLLFEMEPQVDGTVRQFTFEFAPFSDRNFRENTLRQASPASICHYYNIEWRSGMAVMCLVPAPIVDVTLGTILKYVQAPAEMRKDQTFEDTGFEPFMLDAVLAYVKFKALAKPGMDTQELSAAATEWENKRTFALRACGPKQSRDATVVAGIYEEEW